MAHYVTGILLRFLGIDLSGDGGVSFGRWTLSGVTAWIWATWGIHLHEFAVSPLFFCVTMLWAADWVLGSTLAWRDRRYNPRRGTHSIVKLLIWWMALGASWAFRMDGIPLDDMVPYLVGATICWTEFVSILRNGSKLLGKHGGFLSRLADNLEGEVGLHFDRWEDSIRSRREKRKDPQPTAESPKEEPKG